VLTVARVEVTEGASTMIACLAEPRAFMPAGVTVAPASPAASASTTAEATSHPAVSLKVRVMVYTDTNLLRGQNGVAIPQQVCE
jgi:hypothetical protein